MAVGNNITIQSNCAVCQRYTVICVRHLYTQHLSLRATVKNKSEEREEREDKCFLCNENSLSLPLFVPPSFFLYLSARPVPAASLSLRGGGGERGLAGWLAAGWLVWVAADALFPSVFEAGFVSLTWLCLRLQLFQLSLYLSAAFHSRVRSDTHTHTDTHTDTHTKKHAKP